MAYVVARLDTHPSAEALLEHCLGALAVYKLPRRIHFVDALPKGTTGKIDKQVIRRWASETSG